MYVRKRGHQQAGLAFFEILKFSEIAANTGGQAAMVEDRLGRKSQLDFKPMNCPQVFIVQPSRYILHRGFTTSAHILLLKSGGKQQW